jgi:hypothetical protein
MHALSTGFSKVGYYFVRYRTEDAQSTVII